VTLYLEVELRKNLTIYVVTFKNITSETKDFRSLNILILPFVKKSKHYGTQIMLRISFDFLSKKNWIHDCLQNDILPMCKKSNLYMTTLGQARQYIATCGT
jgi:hypothetical protein